MRCASKIVCSSFLQEVERLFSRIQRYLQHYCGNAECAGSLSVDRLEIDNETANPRYFVHGIVIPLNGRIGPNEIAGDQVEVTFVLASKNKSAYPPDDADG